MKVNEIANQLGVKEEVIKKITENKDTEKFWSKHIRINADDFLESTVTASGVMAIKEAVSKNGKEDFMPKPETKSEPSKTNTAEKPKRKRRTKAEMEAARKTDSKNVKSNVGSPKDVKVEKKTSVSAAKPEKKAEKNEYEFSIGKKSPFLSDDKLKKLLDVSKIRKILIKEKLMSLESLAGMSDDEVKNFVAKDFVGIINETEVVLYRKTDF